jgi:acetyl esterase/lipase
MIIPVALCTLVLAFASQTASRPIVSLWPSGNPNGWTRSDTESIEKSPDADFQIVKGVSHPTLEIFLSTNAKPDAPFVIVCPGGGYYIEAIEHEGWEIATRLNTAGINAAVLKYRLPNRDQDHPLHKVALEDAQRAIRIVRARAASWKLKPRLVGIMGFSAGGHAAAVTSTAKEASYAPQDAADDTTPHPDFTVLIYPAYLNVEGTLNLADAVSVSKKTPPAFIVQAMDDPIPIEGALAYTHACHLAGVPVELHLFPKGGHGYGLRSREPGLVTWPDLLIAWINRL